MHWEAVDTTSQQCKESSGDTVQSTTVTLDDRKRNGYKYLARDAVTLLTLCSVSGCCAKF